MKKLSALSIYHAVAFVSVTRVMCTMNISLVDRNVVEAIELAVINLILFLLMIILMKEKTNMQRTILLIFIEVSFTAATGLLAVHCWLMIIKRMNEVEVVKIFSPNIGSASINLQA